jgi:hypothetical protein
MRTVGSEYRSGSPPPLPQRAGEASPDATFGRQLDDELDHASVIFASDIAEIVEEPERLAVPSKDHRAEPAHTFLPSPVGQGREQRPPEARPATATDVRARLTARAESETAATQPTPPIPVVSQTRTLPVLDYGEKLPPSAVDSVSARLVSRSRPRCRDPRRANRRPAYRIPTPHRCRYRQRTTRRCHDLARQRDDEASLNQLADTLPPAEKDEKKKVDKEEGEQED